MLTSLLYRLGFRDWMLQSLTFTGIALCIGLWIRAKTVDDDERGNAERRALFVGLWPPTAWLIGESLRREADQPVRRTRRLRRSVAHRLPG